MRPGNISFFLVAGFFYELVIIHKSKNYWDLGIDFHIFDTAKISRKPAS